MVEQSLKDLKIIRLGLVDILGLYGDFNIFPFKSIPLAGV